jgi:LuxR family transcriptional regulator of spore coat protein
MERPYPKLLGAGQGGCVDLTKKDETTDRTIALDDPMGLLAGLETADGVFIVDQDQRVKHWSRSAQRILGHSPEKALGMLCYEVVAGRDPRSSRFCRRNCPVIANARKGRPTPDYDVLCPTSQGEIKWLNISVAVLRNTVSPFLVLHMFRDVTHRRRIEDFAQKASVAIRQLLNEVKVEPGCETGSRPASLPRLSRREAEVLRLLAASLTTKQIAEALAIKPVTARNHITRLLNKLGVESRLQAVLQASERQLI